MAGEEQHSRQHYASASAKDWQQASYGYGNYGTYGQAAAAAYQMAAYQMAAYGYNAYGYSGYGYEGYDSSSMGSGSSVKSKSKHQPVPESSKGLLEELKAKQAARTSMKDEQKKLREQIEQCDPRAPKVREKIQQRLDEVEMQLRRMGDTVSTGEVGSGKLTEAQRRRLRPPEDGRVDQFGRFCHVLVQFLRARDDCGCALAQLQSERRIQQEWTDLERSRMVDPGMEMKDVLAERSQTFELFKDDEGTSCVRLFCDFGTTAKGSSAKPVEESGSADGPPLRSELVKEIDAYLKKAGGSERVSRLETMFGITRSQLQRHFTLYEDRKKLYATPMPAQNLALASFGASGSSSTGGGQPALGSQTKQLEQFLQQLTPKRDVVLEAMAFCLEHAGSHAGPLARALIRSIEERGLNTESALARLYLVSDVLYNSNSSAKGALRYRTSFQELLPDACEKLGKQWLQRLEKGRLEQSRAQACVKNTLSAWTEWGVFPPLFVKGLEALLFAPVADDASSGSNKGGASQSKEVARKEDQDGENDAALQKKLAKWRTSADAARLPYAARLRGLSGSALPTAACRARLCHYERYWHHRGGSAEEEDEPMDDPWIEQLRRESLGEALDREAAATAAARAASPRMGAATVATLSSDLDEDMLIDEGEDGLDGEPLTEDEEMDDWQLAVEDPYQELPQPSQVWAHACEGFGVYYLGWSGVGWTQSS